MAFRSRKERLELSRSRTKRGAQRVAGSPVARLDLLPQLERRFAGLLRLEGSGLNLARGLVGGEDDAFVGEVMLDPLERAGPLGPLEDALAAAEDDREPHQDQPVDQPGG